MTVWDRNPIGELEAINGIPVNLNTAKRKDKIYVMVNNIQGASGFINKTGTYTYNFVNSTGITDFNYLVQGAGGSGATYGAYPAGGGHAGAIVNGVITINNLATESITLGVGGITSSSNPEASGTKGTAWNGVAGGSTIFGSITAAGGGGGTFGSGTHYGGNGGLNAYGFRDGYYRLGGDWLSYGGQASAFSEGGVATDHDGYSGKAGTAAGGGGKSQADTYGNQGREGGDGAMWISWDGAI